jgi:DNA-binding NtrC family response regulator
LRERLEDIPLLVARFIDKLQPAADGRDPVVVSQEAMRRLMAHDWPGNIRQLENVIERALALGAGRRIVDVDDLPAELRRQTLPAVAPPLTESGLDLPALVQAFERQLIDEALAKTDGNRGAAARLLGLKRTTLVEKLRRLGGEAAPGADA